MSLQDALTKALAEFREARPYVLAAKSGAEYQEGRFRLPFYNRAFLVHFPEGKAEERNAPGPVPEWLQVLLLHYLLHASGAEIADQWITYRHLPGAAFFEARFRSMAYPALLRAYGLDLEGFIKAARSLGGEAMSRTGDAAFRFLAFPRLPVACLLYLGDEEVPPSVNILFDEAAPRYLPTEDLSLVGTYLSRALVRFKASLPELVDEGGRLLKGF